MNLEVLVISGNGEVVSSNFLNILLSLALIDGFHNLFHQDPVPVFQYFFNIENEHPFNLSVFLSFLLISNGFPVILDLSIFDLKLANNSLRTSSLKSYTVSVRRKLLLATNSESLLINKYLICINEGI